MKKERKIIKNKNSGAMKSQYFIIQLHTYPFDVMVSVDETDEVLGKRLERYGCTKEDCAPLMNLKDTVRGRCVMLPTNQTVIRLVLQPKKYEQMGVIVHETFHATTFILDRIGMKLKILTSCEAYAYLQEHLSKEIFKKLKI